MRHPRIVTSGAARTSWALGWFCLIAPLSAVAAAQDHGVFAVPSRHVTATRLAPTRADGRSVIQGNALTASGSALENANVRLRDARKGRILEMTTTDRLGVFAFHPVEPGSYVIELVGSDQTIVAASDIVNVNAGDIATAIVKAPFRPPLAGLFGRTGASVAIVTATAAASGVLAVRVAGSDVTPRK